MGVRTIIARVAVIATLIWRDYVIQGKFMCPTHSEVKQTETLAFGAEKGPRKREAPVPKPPHSSEGFSKAVFKVL